MQALRLQSCHSGFGKYEPTLGAESFGIRLQDIAKYRPDLDGLVERQEQDPIAELVDGSLILIRESGKRVRKQWLDSFFG